MTLQRKSGAYGYFSGGRFGSKDGREVTDEIALNPKHFHKCDSAEILSTLVHEMTHLEQYHFGKPSRRGYHNREWAGLMKVVGLVPSDTGEPGGREVGQRVTHYVLAGGPFDLACAELLERGSPLYGDRFGEGEEARKKKAESKTQYSCPTCELQCLGEARGASGVRRVQRTNGGRIAGLVLPRAAGAQHSFEAGDGRHRRRNLLQYRTPRHETAVPLSD